MKSIKATTIIEGPEEVFISNEANNPTTTDKIPVSYTHLRAHET